MKYIFIILLTFCYQFIFSQEEIFKIPSLESLIDSALVHSPLIKQQDILIKTEHYKKDLIKTEWLKIIKPQFQYSYGSSENTGYFDEDGDYYTNSTTTTSMSSRYTLSLRFTLDIKHFVERKTKLLIAEENIKLSEFEKETLYLSIRKEVILAYNKLILTKKLLDIQSQLYQAQLVQKQLAEEQFTNAEITLSEYTSVISLIFNSMAQYEKIKMDFRTAYQILEESIGVKIIDIKILNEYYK